MVENEPQTIRDYLMNGGVEGIEFQGRFNKLGRKILSYHILEITARDREVILYARVKGSVETDELYFHLKDKKVPKKQGLESSVDQGIRVCPCD